MICSRPIWPAVAVAGTSASATSAICAPGAQHQGGAAQQRRLAGIADAVGVRVDEEQQRDEVVVVARRRPGT